MTTVTELPTMKDRMAEYQASGVPFWTLVPEKSGGRSTRTTVWALRHKISPSFGTVEQYRTSAFDAERVLAWAQQDHPELIFEEVTRANGLSNAYIATEEEK